MNRAKTGTLPKVRPAAPSGRENWGATVVILGGNGYNKSYKAALIAVLAAVAGALAAVALYLNRREKELDEYERLLFGEDDATTVEPEEAAAEDEAE